MVSPERMDEEVHPEPPEDAQDLVDRVKQERLVVMVEIGVQMEEIRVIRGQEVQQEEQLQEVIIA